MKKYYNNPEIKISSVVLMCTVMLCLVFTAYIFKLHNDTLKIEYTQSIGAIAARVIEKHPEMEKDIMPILTKEISKEEAVKGQALLNEYGVNKNLENTFFPHLNKLIESNNNAIIYIFFSLVIILLILNYLQFGFFYKRIRGLTVGATKVVEGEYDIAICEEKEGDFSKLAISFNSMRQIIRNNINELKTEKQFLIDLLSDISHQLKTPLTSMIVYNDIMLDKELSKQQRNTFLINNKNQLYRMGWLIKNLLKLAKLDAKAIELNKEFQSLNETIQESIDALGEKAIEENIKISFIEKGEIFFNHDRLWVEEAINNIIKNSVEHTPKGGQINIELCENPVYRRIIIEDTGEGIKQEDLPNIFKRFYKAKTSKKSDSIGIGLALAKSIIQAHKGLIDVKSQEGTGTTFIITFLKY